MKFEIVKVTPELASAWLALNTDNRKLRPTHVRALSDAMKRGEWMVNHQPVALNGTRLLDGQHRLTALIKSGLPYVEMSVITGAPSDSFKTIDIGAKRGIGDILRADKRVVEGVRLVASIVSGAPNPTPTYVGQHLDVFGDIFAEVVQQVPTITRFWTSAPVKVAAVAAICSGENKQRVLSHYKKMANFEVEGLPPVCISLMHQATKATRVKAINTREVLARTWTAFLSENADIRKINVKDPNVRFSEIRDALTKEFERKSS